MGFSRTTLVSSHPLPVTSDTARLRHQPLISAPITHTLKELPLAQTLLIEPVVRLCAIITRFDDARDWAMQQIEMCWGKIAEHSAEIPFEAGGYYSSQMGENLMKTLVAVETFADPAGVADWKHQTNLWENKFAEESDHEVARPLNLDAGYLSQAKLLLATTKDRDHRVYLRDGMFAEITLNYIGKRWVHHRWSYPSYRTDEVADFATRCRKRLRSYLIETEQLRARPSNMTPKSQPLAEKTNEK